MRRRRVDFPHPDGPTIATKSESLTSKEMSCMIEIVPCREAKLLSTCSTWISAKVRSPSELSGSRYQSYRYRSTARRYSGFHMSSLMMMTDAISANSAATISGYPPFADSA